MAGLGKLAKLAWKGISYLPKKAHALQTPFTAPAGGKLSTGKKIANCIFKTTEVASFTSMFGACGLAAYECYKGATSDTHKESEEHALKCSKYIDAAVGGLAGFILGGPIGALALGTAAYLTKKDLVCGNLPACKHGGKDVTFNELRQQQKQEALQAEKAEEVPEEQPEQVKEETPEVKADKTAVEKFCNELENIQVGQSVTVPELTSETGELTMQVGEQKVQLHPGDKITRTEDGFEITKANQPAEQQDEFEEPAEQNEEPQVDNNIFGGTINEITTESHDVVKNECLWNIAKHYLQEANPDKTISNGQILAQVKEFIRLNPQIKNPDLIYPEQKIKMCA
ncbi:MAG: LysM peptidoglycan-binding domain-containing protein [Fusobacterium sp.]|nr:LysM peptidoglycan-binding domain-containing protein [Fusobacterium sp.]